MLCYSLGAVAYSGARFGQGTGPIIYSSIVCTGSEISIADCTSVGFDAISSTTCTHADDASMMCQEGEIV